MLAVAGRMHELALAYINADMGNLAAFGVEKYQVTRFQMVVGRVVGGEKLRSRCARDGDAGVAVGVAGQATAIEATRRMSTGTVRFAKHTLRGFHNHGTRDRAGCCGSRCQAVFGLTGTPGQKQIEQA